MLIVWARAFALLLGSARAARPSRDERSRRAPTFSPRRSYDDIRRGVEALAASGEPRAAPILAALQEGRLFARTDRTLLIKSAAGWTDARTGEAVPDPGSPRPVHLNNAVRRALEAGLGSLRLFAPEPAARQAAAEAVFKARDAGALSALNRAIAGEQNATVRRTMEQARAATLLASPEASESDRLAAISILRARGDIDARALLSTLSGQSQPVTDAAASAVIAIDWNLQLWGLLQNAYYGLSLGSVLLLAATGLAITFGVMGVINMAHGELVMLGAYTTFLVQEAIRAHAPFLFGASLFIAIPLAFLVAGLAGVAIERGLIRFLYGRPLETLLATFGLSLVLQQAVRSLFGPTNRAVGTPEWMSGATQFGGLTLTWNRLCIIVFAIGVLAALMAVLRFTALGLRMRAVTQNRRMAAAMGIRTPWIDALTFGLGSGVAGMAGVALSQIDNVSPNLGQGYIIDSFMVVVFGGVGNLWGTALGALDAWCHQQVSRARRRRRAGQDRGPRSAYPVHPAAAPRHVPGERPGGGSVSRPIAYLTLALVLGGVATARDAKPRDRSRGGAACADLRCLAGGQVFVFRDSGAGARFGLGLRRHLESRARGILRARRVRDGHVSHAPDRHARRLWQPGAARFHGVPELEDRCLGIGTASSGFRSPYSWRRSFPAHWRWFSGGSRSAAASRVSISRS